MTIEHIAVVLETQDGMRSHLYLELWCNRAL
jgi:hypothetical protein